MSREADNSGKPTRSRCERRWQPTIAMVTGVVEAAGGRVFQHTADGTLFAAFGSVAEAAQAAEQAQLALVDHPWGNLGALKVRMSVDVGEVDVRGRDFFGSPMNRGTRLMSAAHGGQILISAAAADQLRSQAGVQIRSLGEHRFRGLGTPQQVLQLVVADLDSEFPELRIDTVSRLEDRQFGDAIRGFEIRQRIGVGRFGSVYRAYQPSVGREVAVKVIPPEYANHQAFVRRFEGEARLVAKLSHPHIVPLFDYWRDHEGAYLVMPYLPGGNLGGSRHGALPVERVTAIISQIGSALAYAHGQGVIHRDVNPANLLLDEEGNAYLGDFGIAVRAVEQAAGVMATSQPYRAPEDRDGAAVDSRTDIFSLAAVTAELLLGRPLDRGDLKTIPDPLRGAIERGTQLDPDKRFDSIDEYLAALLPATRTGEPPSRLPAFRNPYKGLAAFDESDSRDFFGREAEIAGLSHMLGEKRFVTVVGPSGSGKSSLVQAGLVPSLKAGRLPGSADWVIVTAIPGTHPFDALATALGGVATEGLGDFAAEIRSDKHGLLRVSNRLMKDLEGDLVIVLDQFEEMYSLVSDDDIRSAFIARLIEATEDPDSRVRVLATIRADFFDQPLSHERLGPIVSSAHLALAVPGRDQLLEAIERPATAAGLDLDPGLVHQIVADVLNEPGGLPMMQFVLKDLVDRAESGRVSTAAYLDAGGVSGALSRRATQVYLGLEPADRHVAEQIFMRLVTVSDEVDDVRRRVRRSELESMGLDRGAVDRVLDAFGSARLLTFDRDPVTRGPTVEVAHEALLREWDLFGDWVTARRATLLTHRRLTMAMDEWATAQQSEDGLPIGGRLAQFEELAVESSLALTGRELEFLEAAATRRDRDLAERRRRRRIITSGFAIAAAVAMILATVAWLQRGVARQEASLAQARELIANARDALELDPDLSGLLALNAIDAFQTAGEVPGEAVSALRGAITAQRVRFRIPGGRFVAVHPGGSLLATADGNGVAVWDATTREVAESYSRGDAVSAEAAFSPDGNLLAVYFKDVDPPVTVWDRTSGESFEIGAGLVTDLPVITFNADGSLLAFGSVGPGVEVWSVDEPSRVMEVEGFGPDFAGNGLMSHGFCIEGESSFEDCEVRVVDPTSGQVIRAFTSDVLPFFTAWSPDGSRIVMASQDVAVVRDAESGQEISRTDVDRVYAPRWLPSGEAFVAGAESFPRLFDATTGEVLMELAGQTGGTFGLEVVPGAPLVASPGLSDETVLFDISELGGLELGGWVAPVETTWHTAFGPDGLRAVVADRESVVSANALDGRDAVMLPGMGSSWFPVPSRDGSLAPVRDLDGRWVIRRTDTTDVVYRAPEGWAIHGFDPGSSRAVIHREDGPSECQTRLVSMADDSASIELEAGCLGKVEFSPDGELVVTHNLDDFAAPYGTAIFKAQTGELLRSTLVGETAEGLVADFTPDGSRYVVVSVTGTLTVFDLPMLLSGAPLEDADLLVIPAHDGLVANLSVSPDGSMAISSTRNESLKLWSLETGQLLSQFGGNLEPGTRDVGAFHPTEPWLLVASPPNLIRIHTLDVDELIEIARSRFTREMTDEECQRYLRQACEG